MYHEHISKRSTHLRTSPSLRIYGYKKIILQAKNVSAYLRIRELHAIL